MMDREEIEDVVDEIQDILRNELRPRLATLTKAGVKYHYPIQVHQISLEEQVDFHIIYPVEQKERPNRPKYTASLPSYRTMQYDPWVF